MNLVFNKNITFIILWSNLGQTCELLNSAAFSLVVIQSLLTVISSRPAQLYPDFRHYGGDIRPPGPSHGTEHEAATAAAAEEPAVTGGLASGVRLTNASVGEADLGVDSSIQ